MSTPPPDVTIGVMGMTGTGKSSLIRLITGDESIKVGVGLESVTTKVGLAHYFEEDGSCITLVDTPGFDDSRGEMTDRAVLEMIAAYLDTEYEDGKKLHGIIYMHRITDPKLGMVSHRKLKLFQNLCGSNSLKNVVVVTSRWDELRDEESLGDLREGQLKSDFFQTTVRRRCSISPPQQHP